MPRVVSALFGGSLGSRLLAWAVCVTIVLLVYVGFRATAQSRDSMRQLLERRQSEQLALLWLGLAQDMEGAQKSVLMPLPLREFESEPPFDLADAFATGFANFPYPESFFIWKQSDTGEGTTYVFNRADRPPLWPHAVEAGGPYPVNVLRNPPAFREVVVKARNLEVSGQRVTVFTTRIHGAPYQVVVRFLSLYEGSFADMRSGPPLGLVGFTVNLDWVRQSYFRDLIAQISRISNSPEDVAVDVLDEGANVVVAVNAARDDIDPITRSFPLLFANRSLLRTLPPDEVLHWTVRARAATESRLANAVAGTGGTFLVLSLVAMVAVAAWVATASQVRAESELAVMKSEFVSNVTHELKTPLSVIQLIAETLSSGRYGSPARVPHYAKLLDTETQKFTRLIDNILAYARLSESDVKYSVAPAHANDLVDEALDGFQALLAQRAFRVEVAVPDDLPVVLVDRRAVLQALENVVDNAIKYSVDRRELRVQGGRSDHSLVIAVSDRGVGISDDEIDRVCDKFFRGRGVKNGGSGLGLAITRQIVEAHGGRLSIQSTVGYGTRVELSLPLTQV